MNFTCPISTGKSMGLVIIFSLIVKESENEDESTSLLVVSVNDTREWFKMLTEFREINNVNDEFVEYLNNLQDCFDEHSHNMTKETKINNYFKDN